MHVYQVVICASLQGMDVIHSKDYSLYFPALRADSSFPHFPCILCSDLSSQTPLCTVLKESESDRMIKKRNNACVWDLDIYITRALSIHRAEEQ